MSVLQAYVGVVRRAKSAAGQSPASSCKKGRARRAPEDVIEDLETQIEILQAIVRDLSGIDLVIDLRRIYPEIPPMSLRVLALFLRRDIVNRAALMAALYGDRTDEPAERTMEVHLCRLRVRLPEDSIVNHRGMGWSLATEIKADIRARLAALNAPPLTEPQAAAGL